MQEIAELRGLLQQRRLKASGNKAELRRRLRESSNEVARVAQRTVPELRARLRKRRLKVGGKKVQLVGRVLAADAKLPAEAIAELTRTPSIRLLGDSNAVGYRAPPEGTRSVLAETLSLSQDLEVLPTFGRCGLTLLHSSLHFRSWLSAELDETAPMVDYTVLVLGTNDITCLKTARMRWSATSTDENIGQIIGKELGSLLDALVFPQTRRKVLVTEPVNQMPSKCHFRNIVVSALRKSVDDRPNVLWVDMGWRHGDLQILPSGAVDAVHFSCRGAKRLARAIRATVDADRGLPSPLRQVAPAAVGEPQATPSPARRKRPLRT